MPAAYFDQTAKDASITNLICLFLNHLVIDLITMISFGFEIYCHSHEPIEKRSSIVVKLAVSQTSTSHMQTDCLWEDEINLIWYVVFISHFLFQLGPIHVTLWLPFPLSNDIDFKMYRLPFV